MTSFDSKSVRGTAIGHLARICPNCGQTVLGIQTDGPGVHRVGPCGHRVGSHRIDDLPRAGETEREIVTDGGHSWYDLRTFERDVLEAMAELQGEDTLLYGLAIKRRLEDFYDQEVHHGRLYPNLNELVEKGLVEKRERTVDDRTNEYHLTDDARLLLQERADRWADLKEPLRRPTEVVTDGGRPATVGEPKPEAVEETPLPKQERCNDCGRLLSQDWSFCPSCGEDQGVEEDA